MIRTVLPIGVLLIGVVTSLAVLANRSQPEPDIQQPTIPHVEVLEAQPQTVRLTVKSQGIAMPRTEIDLVTEVAGKVTRVHPSFAAGGFFSRGDMLIMVDPRDYQLAMIEAKSRLAEARRQLAQEEAQGDQALNEWHALGEGTPTPLALRKPQLAEMRAKVAAAKAELAKATLQRSRCVLTAPFDGRIRTKLVDVGQYIVPGETVARLYATDSAEVRLPVSMDELSFIDVSSSYRPSGQRSDQSRAMPTVTLSAMVGGTTARWEGRIIRAESALEPTTGQLFLVARVPNPFAAHDNQPPLLPGTFVQANIEGRERPGIFILPPSAINTTSNEVMIVDHDNRVAVRQLDVLKQEPDRILVRGGLQAGDRIVLSGIDVPVDGIEVQVVSPQS
ncbi:MAG: efflux RND transporter periplasmic adaptor subunit [Nitrospirales bacterium]|nr:efflux RND transporter periplasmic adaptor subunit [Nitrospirales bacterium]